MKKIFIALSAMVIVLAFVFVGCGKKEDGEVSTTSTTTTTSTTATTTTRSSTSATDKENIEDKITSALSELSTMMNR
ncbi:MAG: hypothetical protein MJ168_01140 [Clostridia bacterium]|nr:hypothetical protein [Clostridia bacterium]